nr:bifunctional tRNA (5-methylaminomethyl-2-thiouridine)(34)-methyltransferase MnmD/FAD-dependent 5-carboxymethylaminomethyl-2-thiouridine(34) oxidoreductase MnmC [Candidatus Pantoea persica]
MWTPRLFTAMAQLARPGANFATFTAAGFVRSGLQQTGFAVARRKGFGHKREMLCGTLADAPPLPAEQPWYACPAARAAEAAIVGGGIASAILALAMPRRVWWVTLYCADGGEARHENVVLATGHSLTALAQNAQLPAYAVAGQVSHVPSMPGLAALKSVLCYDGYLTPVSPQFGTHCIGANYHRGETATDYREADQQQNRAQLLHCVPDCGWPEAVDVNAGEARGEPQPLDSTTLAVLGPNRYWVRRLLKGKKAGK